MMERKSSAGGTEPGCGVADQASEEDHRDADVDHRDADVDHRDEDRHFMRLALQEARRAGQRGEVPVGAVLARDGMIVASRGNERESRCDPTAHAEILALRDSAAQLGGWRLSGATMYVTLEPCPMCMGALVQARVARLVYGAADPKSGAAGSVLDLASHPGLNHRVAVTGGVLAEEAADILQSFFTERR